MTPPAQTSMDTTTNSGPPKRFKPEDVEDEEGFRFPNPKRFARLRNMGTTSTPVNNRYQPLRNQQPQQGTSTTTPKPRKHPPIVIRSKVGSISLCDLLKRHGAKDFGVSPGQLETRVFLGPGEDFDAVLKLFSAQGFLFYTYAQKGSTKRTNRFTVRGLDLTHNLDNIKAFLTANLKGFISVHRLSRTEEDGTRTETPVLMVVTEAETKEEDLKRLGHIEHIRVRVGTFKTDGGPVQCQNCQELGHTKKYCWLYVTCVRCGKRHPDATCPTPQGPIKCRNCGGPHVASWRQCPARQQLKRQEAAKPVQYQPAPPPTASAWDTPLYNRTNQAQQSTHSPTHQAPPGDGMPAWAQHMFTILTSLMTTITELVSKIGTMRNNV